MPVRALFTATILLSAFLLFLIQPMLSKMILPHLGGNPAVWQTAMMFFQSMLLIGYIYAHASTRWLGTQRQAKLHAALLVLSALCMPLSLHLTSLYEATATPILFLLVSLFLTIALPFFVLAANAPLIQHWHASHQQTQGHDPYRLYSASNLGSFAALLSYPFLVEPLLALPAQAQLWSWLYGAFSMLLLLCAYQLHRHFAGETPMPADTLAENESMEQLEAAEVPTNRQKIRWVLLAFVPSSLMLGVTTHMTSDVASAPLLWVIPLALYLLTFVLAFHPKMPGYAFFVREQVVVTAMLLFAMASGLDIMSPFQLIHFLAFFVFAIVCHGQLSLHRPKARHLTEFYVWISVGGALGGVFNALIAPELFLTAFEYPLVLVLGCLLRPQTEETRHAVFARTLDVLIPAAMAALLLAQYYGSGILAEAFPESSKTLLVNVRSTFQGLSVGQHTITMVLALGFCFFIPRFCQARPLRLGLAAFILFLAMPYARDTSVNEILYRERNFFGISTVQNNPNAKAHYLVHGTTLHGLQSTEEEYRLKLSSYYVQVRDIYNSMPEAVRQKPVAVAGLGTGTLACLGNANQRFDFYEIDVAMQHIAENPELFTYLRDCPPQKNIIIGDGRLGLESAPDGEYGAIVLDAYSSDALPMHLMTREALAIYLKKLAPGGIIAFHISSRYLILNQIIANLAYDANVFAIERNLPATEKNAAPSHWVIVSRSMGDLADSAYEKEGWKVLQTNGRTPWSDNYSNLLEALR